MSKVENQTVIPLQDERNENRFQTLSNRTLKWFLNNEDDFNWFIRYTIGQRDFKIYEYPSDYD